MSGIGILAPFNVAAIGVSPNVTGGANLLTPSPREVVTTTAADTYIAVGLDFGVVKTVDCFYLGGIIAPDDVLVRVFTATNTAGAGAVFLASSNQLPDRLGPGHVFIRFTAVATRYLYFTMTRDVAATLMAGVALAGQIWTHPYAYGAGRQLIDTTRRLELADGGFGLEPGICKAAFKWRFIDLDATEREQLWQLTYGRGLRRPVAVTEEANIVTPKHAAVHYGLFDKFEAYERASEADTSWALSMTEWV